MPDHYDDLLPEDLAKLLDNQQAVNRLAGLRFAGQVFGPAANVLATPPQDIAKRSLTGGVTGILDILGNLQRDVAGTTNRLDQRFPELGIGQADPQFSGDPLRSGLGLTPGAPDELFEMFGPDLPFGKLAGLFGTAKILKLGGKAEIARRKAGKDFAVASKDIDELNRTVLGPLETDFFQKYGFAHRDAPRGRAVAAEIATTRGGTMSVEARKQWVDTYLKDVGQIDEALNRRFEMLTRQAGLEQDIFRIDSKEASERLGFEITATEWGDEHVQTAIKALDDADSPIDALRSLQAQVKVIRNRFEEPRTMSDVLRGPEDEAEAVNLKMAFDWLRSKLDK
jgi:hypothetical protein